MLIFNIYEYRRIKWSLEEVDRVSSWGWGERDSGLSESGHFSEQV